jgi:hypothetical protein
MRALIFNGVVLQTGKSDFPHRFGCEWVDCDDDTVTRGYKYQGGKFIAPPTPADTTYKEKREAEILAAFPIIKQLEAITEDAMGRPELLNELKTVISNVKTKYPKG